MACEGYEHGDTVVLERVLRDLPEGLIGVVVGIERSKHTLDVRFQHLGVVKGLDAHAFRSEKPQKGQRDEYYYRDEFEAEGEGA